MLAPVLTASILCAYAASLWWLLRRESGTVLIGVLAICGFSLCLRLVYTTDFPPGFDDDEAKLLSSAIDLRRLGLLFRPSAITTPGTLKALFEATLYQFVPGFWAVRGCSMAASVLAAPAAFAAARALRLRVAASLAAAAFVAVLPWSILWGRMMVGGQLVFHQLLLLAALGGIVWGGGGWAEVGIGGFGLALLCYDYFCGQAMLGMPLVAAIVARGWRMRMLSVATLIFGLILWGPYLHENHWDALASVNQSERLLGDVTSLVTIGQKTLVAFHALVAPVAADFSMSVRSGAMHPPLILALALLGTVVGGGVSRFLFLWCGFLGGVAPAILHSDFISAKRMLIAYPFIALAAACALDRAGDRLWARIATALVVLVVSVQSVKLYFSPAFWSLDHGVFETARSELMESLPPPGSPRPRLIADQQLGYELILPHYDSEPLTVENWIPPDREPVTYIFDSHAAALLPFYVSLFGAWRVRTFHGAFRVDLEGRDWSWLRQHGWAHEVRCGANVRRGQVPTLFRVGKLTFRDMRCSEPATYVWRGRWLGPASTLRLFWSDMATVDTSAGRVIEGDGFERLANFQVEPQTAVTVTVVSPVSSDPAVQLFEVTPLGETFPLRGQVPAWEKVSPLPDAD